jgi:hypothetical protein
MPFRNHSFTVIFRPKKKALLDGFGGRTQNNDHLAYSRFREIFKANVEKRPLPNAHEELGRLGSGPGSRRI